MVLFLTSSPVGIYRSDEPVSYAGFNPANGMVEELKRFWKESSRCLLISAFPDETAINDRMRHDYEKIVEETGLSIACMDICDSRNGEMKAFALSSYDFVILGGGHVPTENAFFAQIGLAERFRSYEGIVMGISAGSMNCADVVYAQPELPGEATDLSYRKFISGLGLTKYNILPHYNAVKYDWVDGLRLMEDITYPDSMGRTFYAITDGSYLLQTDHASVIRGEAYRIQDGRIERIGVEGSAYVL
ncbi:MAG: Type 1 glutamine amidotransferase-like domain-containing protein [Lachnospiraceae bacterium]|nr:Type 1 glutamine amidotransferase-like domain-containing protein [Lachnospiraceae bacterium]